MKAERIANALGHNVGTGRTAGCPTHDDRPARIARFSSASAARDATRQPGQDSAQRRWTVLRSWKPIRKGALIGFTLVSFPSRLQIDDVPVLLSHGSAWATLLAKPVITSEGVAKLTDAHKTQYVSLLCWRDRAQGQEFSTAIARLLRLLRRMRDGRTP
jgi:hypothetical protein